MSVFIPCKDGFYYKIAESKSLRSVCIKIYSIMCIPTDIN